MFDPTLLIRMWWLLIIVPPLVLGSIVLAIVLITLTKKSIHNARARRSMAAAEKAKLDPRGQPYPPSGRGLCDQCGKPSEKVFYLSSGRRICSECYDAACRAEATK